MSEGRGALRDRWRNLPSDRRDDLINRAVVYTFCGVVGIGGLIVLASSAAGFFGVVAVMIACAALAFFIAESKQRGRWRWAAACFLLPVLGLAVLLTLPSRPSGAGA
jgi:hypothetical protein